MHGAHGATAAPYHPNRTGGKGETLQRAASLTRITDWTRFQTGGAASLQSPQAGRGVESGDGPLTLPRHNRRAAHHAHPSDSDQLMYRSWGPVDAYRHGLPLF